MSSVAYSPINITAEEEEDKLLGELIYVETTDYILGEYDTNIHGNIHLKLNQIKQNSFGKYGKLSDTILKKINPKYISDIKKVDDNNYKLNMTFHINTMMQENDNKLMIWWDNFDDVSDYDNFVVDYITRDNVSFDTWITYSDKEVKNMITKC
jgi:hypothetical protein